ncbi:MAG TPA: hypothetical protein VFP54_05630 [Acidimicrobiales bacterium]|nr:hypothetical protein [Acidimicrobiales bacterium]
MATESRKPQPPDGWRRQGRADTRFDAQLVLFEVGPRSIALDCTAGDRRLPRLGGRTLESGEPFTVAVGLPSPVWHAVAVRTLEDWAADGSMVHFQTVERRAGARIVLSDAVATVTFDLLAFSGL